MVAVVTELMVGGERSTQDDSIKGSARTLVSKLRPRALLQATARTHLSLTTSSPLLTYTLTQTFFIRNFPLEFTRRTIHSATTHKGRLSRLFWKTRTGGTHLKSGCPIFATVLSSLRWVSIPASEQPQIPHRRASSYD